MTSCTNRKPLMIRITVWNLAEDFVALLTTIQDLYKSMILKPTEIKEVNIATEIGHDRT